MRLLKAYWWVLVVVFLVWLAFVFYQMGWAADVWNGIKGLHGGG